MVIGGLAGCGPQPGAWPDAWIQDRVALWEGDGGTVTLRVAELASGRTVSAAQIPRPHSSWAMARAAVGDAVAVVEVRPARFEAFLLQTGAYLGTVAASDCEPVGALAANRDGHSLALAWGPEGRCGERGMALHSVQVAYGLGDGAQSQFHVDELTESPGRVHAVGWAADGSSLAYTEALDAGTWRLRVLDVGRQTVRTELEAAGPLVHPGLSEDGVESAVAEKDRVFVGDNAVELDGEVAALRWTEDPGTLLAQTQAGAAWSIDVQSGTATPLVAADPGALLVGDSPSGEGPRWLPRCEDDGVALGQGDDAQCISGIERATWSHRQDALLLEGHGAVYLADPSGEPIEAIADDAFDARWLP